MEETKLFRRFNRFKTGNKCRAKLILADEVKIKDISFGGILIETTRLLNINRSYRIQLISSGNESITPQVKVVRSFLRGTAKVNKKQLPLYYVALEFKGLKDNEKLFLDKLIGEIADKSVFSDEYKELKSNDF